jgi:hypothetical protein
MHALRQRLLVLAVALASGKMPAQTTTLFSDDLSSISNWVYFNSTSVRVSGGKLLVDDSQHAIAFFSAPGGGKQTIGANESLKVTFNLSFRDPVDSATGMRMGLFDSNSATLPTALATLTSANDFKGYDGYMVSWNAKPPSGNNTLALRSRTPGASASSMLTDSFPNTFSSSLPATSSLPFHAFQVGVDYTVSYTVSRAASAALTISFSVTGGTIPSFTLSSVVGSPSTSEFNAFSLYSTNSDFSIDNVLITHTTPVPEPSTYAACAGAAVLGLAFWRRRRAAAQALAA